ALGSQFAIADGASAAGRRTGWSFENEGTWSSCLIDPRSASTNEEQVMVQGENALPYGIRRLSATSSLYPRRSR
ncbi:MAG TPA: hypothetical protein VE360_08705, partial [Pyrinomonadaceae bacterium]|nr:hypothetical protein [Pyrinomonadaceae bacterium]